MSNFTLETNRNNSLSIIPRLTFQMPQSTSSATPSTTIPIYFCQTGCQLEFQFTNITSATLKNDGTYFTIIPTENSNNYINWNGSGVSGQNMTRFDLKEIKFVAPAKDVVGSITYNKSIQFYFTFVNSTYPNIMIVITIIGQANNVGTAQTDGFILLKALAPQIPIRNEVKTVSNLRNINLGNLLPANKSFFSTLINGNSIQYISMTRIIDIPENFLEYMISMVVGGKQAYDNKVNTNNREIPSNPQGTIIFYTENVKPINSDQAYVCNANCDRVVGDATLLQPTFGTSNTLSNGEGNIGTKTVGGAQTVKPTQEECEEEYVFPGSRTLVKINSATTSSVSGDKSNEKNLSTEDYITSIVKGILITLFLLIIIFGSITILFFMAKASNVNFTLQSFFSKELWNKENLLFIFIGLFGFSSIVSFTIAALIELVKEIEDPNTKDPNKSEQSNLNKKIGKIKPWVLLIIGVLCIYLPCLVFLWFMSKKYSNLLNYNRSNIELSNNYLQRNSKYKSEISLFNNQTSKILNNYQKNPSDFFKQNSQGITDILKASKQYNELSPTTKSMLEKTNPKLSNLFNPDSKFIKDIKSSDYESSKLIFNNSIDSLKTGYSIVTPKLIKDFQTAQILDPNSQYLKDINKKMIIGNIVPKELEQYIYSIKSKP